MQGFRGGGEEAQASGTWMMVGPAAWQPQQSACTGRGARGKCAERHPCLSQGCIRGMLADGVGIKLSGCLRRLMC